MLENREMVTVPAPLDTDPDPDVDAAGEPLFVRLPEVVFPVGVDVAAAPDAVGAATEARAEYKSEL